MPGTIFCHLLCLSVSETISLISISFLLPIWSSWSSEAGSYLCFSSNTLPTPPNPSSRLISLSLWQCLSYFNICIIFLAFLLLHLIHGALFWSIISHHRAGSAIMNNGKKKKKKREQKQNIEKEMVFELSQLPWHWWYFLWVNMESWRDKDVNSLQHYKGRRSVIDMGIQWNK